MSACVIQTLRVRDPRYCDSETGLSTVTTINERLLVDNVLISVEHNCSKQIFEHFERPALYGWINSSFVF